MLIEIQTYNDTELALFLMFAVMIIAVLLYFLPTVLGRNHRQFNAIFVLNLLAGWTVVGWVGAMVWALTKPEK